MVRPVPRGRRAPPGRREPGAPGYAYLYSSGRQSLELGQAVAFESNGAISAGFSHEPGQAALVLDAPGTYLVSFAVQATEPNQMSVYLDEEEVPGSIYGSPVAGLPTGGNVIVTSTAPGQLLSIRAGKAGKGGLELQVAAGGEQRSTNASLTVQALEQGTVKR